MSDGRYRLGVDVGGTFTDICVHEAATGELSIYKVLTTRENPGWGLIGALRAAATGVPGGLRGFLGRTERLVYGTTAATNAVLTGATARVGLLCTAGFRDVLAIREAGKEDPFDWHVDYPLPFVPRRLTRPVRERVTAEGDVLVALQRDEVARAVEFLRGEGVDAIAVSYLWSFVNPEHELATREVIESEWPEVACKLSHEVNPIPREYRRTIATAIDAALDGLVGSDLLGVWEVLRQEGYAGEIHVVSCEGGTKSVREMIERPILAVGSGPTMAAVAARRVVECSIGDRSTLVVLDMGGTSLDVSVVRDGAVLISRETRVGPDLLGIARVDVRSVGAGGGSIARVDAGGLLTVGPQSVGSDPGPACYGRGGVAPTVTDANLLLGYLAPVLGGQIRLDVDGARRALTPVARALDLEVTEAARAVVATMNQQIIESIESVTVREGVDPREATLVAGGGACGLHAASLADGLGVAEVIVPRQAGTLSAFGALIGDLTYESTVGAYVRSDHQSFDDVNQRLGTLVVRAKRFLARSRTPRERWRLRAVCEARYVAQVWELDVPVHLGPTGSWIDADVLDEIVREFHGAHERVYGVSHPDQLVELLAWRVRAEAPAEPFEAELEATEPSAGGDDARLAYVEGSWTPIPFFTGGGLKVPVEGPAIIQEPTTTILVPPAWTLTSLPGAAYSLTRPETPVATTLEAA